MDQAQLHDALKGNPNSVFCLRRSYGQDERVPAYLGSALFCVAEQNGSRLKTGSSLWGYLNFQVNGTRQSLLFVEFFP